MSAAGPNKKVIVRKAIRELLDKVEAVDFQATLMDLHQQGVTAKYLFAEHNNVLVELKRFEAFVNNMEKIANDLELAEKNNKPVVARAKTSVPVNPVAKPAVANVATTVKPVVERANTFATLKNRFAPHQQENTVQHRTAVEVKGPSDFKERMKRVAATYERQNAPVEHAVIAERPAPVPAAPQFAASRNAVANLLGPNRSRPSNSQSQNPAPQPVVVEPVSNPGQVPVAPPLSF